MTQTRPTAPDTGLWATLRADFRKTLGDAKHTGYGRTVSQTLAGLESYYLPEPRRQELARMSVFRRFFYRGWWLFTALFYKLAPGRRVLLVIGLVALALSYGQRGPQTQGSVSWALIGVVCVLLVLMLELREKLVAVDELAEGRAIQQALLPKTTPSIPGFEIWLDTTPANDVGGDIVDVLQAEDGRFFLLLGDVAGKGLGAALLAARLQATFRALAPDASSLGALGEQLNRIFHRDGPSNRFATAVALAGRPAEATLLVLNAGHPPPLLVRRGQATPLTGAGPALGIIPGARYTEHALTLEKGDALVVYSDGVTEAMNPDGDFFGDERLASTLRALAGSPPAEIGRAIQQSVRAFEAGERPHDDLSLIVVCPHYVSGSGAPVCGAVG
jgi:hypothetical protein